MLKEILSLYPKEIRCDDASAIGNEGMAWESLDNIYDEIDNNNNYFQDGNKLLGGLSWSFLVGIVEGFRRQYVNKNKPCNTVKILDIVDLDKTKEHFIETVEDETWQDYLKEIGEKILFDEISKKDLI
jgi:hypothetical protein